MFNIPNQKQNTQYTKLQHVIIVSGNACLVRVVIIVSNQQKFTAWDKRSIHYMNLNTNNIL